MTMPLPTSTGYTPPRKLRPGPAGYIVGGIAVLMSFFVFIGFVIWGAVGEFSWVSDAPTITGAAAAVELEANTEYVLYLDLGYRSATRAEAPPTVTDPAGDVVPVDVISELYTVDLNDQYLEGYYRFTTNDAGDYDIQRNITGDSLDMVVGPPIGSAVLPKLLWGLGIGTLLGVGGLILIIVTAFRRKRDKAERDRSGSGNPGAAPTLYQPSYGYPGAATGAPQPPPTTVPPPTSYGTPGPSSYPGTPSQAVPPQVPPPE